MRTKLVTIALAGALAVGGAAVTGTALAATDDGATPAPAPSAPPGAPEGVRPQAPPDATARADRIKKALAGLVADKTLTQEQADKVASTLAASGGGPGAPGRRGGPHGFGGRQGAGLTAAAKALGMSETDLATALRSGKSLAGVAKEKGVAVQKVIDALVAEAKQRLADAVKNGRLTQAQADQRLKDLTARITERVNSTRPARPGGMGHGFGHGGFGPGAPGAPAPVPNA